MNHGKGKSGLLPVDWVAVEPHFRAGIRSLRSIGLEFGVVPSAILKHFGKLGIKRDLRARVIARAEEMVNEAAVNRPVNSTGTAAHEREIVSAASVVLANVQLSHRVDIARLRTRVARLSAELDLVCDLPELYAMVHMVLDHPDEPGFEALRAAVRLVESLPARVALVKALAEALRIVIGLEREAHGLDTASGSDGRPLVIIKDFTGRGDPDSPGMAPSLH